MRTIARHQILFLALKQSAAAAETVLEINFNDGHANTKIIAYTVVDGRPNALIACAGVN